MDEHRQTDWVQLVGYATLILTMAAVVILSVSVIFPQP
jgi:hypothetical protein